MIVRIGTDLVETSRIQTAMRRPGFLQRILTPNEIAISTSPNFVAGRWAAKEAIYKCLPELSSWHDVEILRAANGAPIVSISHSSFQAGQTIHLSISHERGMAVAFAVLEKQESS